MRWLDGITDSIHTNLGKLREMVRDREAWHAAANRVSKSRIWLGDWTTTQQSSCGFPNGSVGKESTCNASHRRCGFDPWVGKIPWRGKWQPTLAFLPEKVPWTEETGGLQSMDSQRVGYNWITKHTHSLLVETTFMFQFLVSNPLKRNESIETHVKQSDWRVIFRFYYYFPTTYYCLTYTWWNSIF